MRILIFSPDGPDFAGRLSALLEREAVVSSVAGADDVNGMFEADVVIVRHGAGATAVLRAVEHQKPLMLVVAASAEPQARTALLDAGADYILHGDVPLEEVVAQVRAIARRLPHPFAEDKAARRVAVVVHTRADQALVFGRVISLTAMESKLLSVMTAEPGRTFSQRELMVALWGSGAGGQSTVSSYIRRLRLKIEPEPGDPVLIRTERGAGYFFEPEPITEENHSERVR